MPTSREQCYSSKSGNINKKGETYTEMEIVEPVEELKTSMNSFHNKFQSMLAMAKSMREEEKIYRYNGVLYPVIISPEENLRALKTLEARSDDIMLVAYPKCGFNWMIAILRKIITAGTGEKIEFKMPPLLEFFGPEMLQMLVIFRNPKDTVVSFYHFSNKNPVLPSAEPWDQFLMDFISGEVPWGSYFDHVLAWEEHINDSNIMIITFEELKQDLRGSVQKVAEFSGFKLSDGQIKTITEESTFKAMKKGSKDSHGEMGNVFFRKGEVGDWRNHFSQDQNEQMNAAFEKLLGGTKLGARLNYDVYCK